MKNSTFHSAPGLVVRTRVDPTSYADASLRITSWAEQEPKGYVCAANVHMVMEGYDNPDFQATVNGARLVTPDGMPLVLMLRWTGARGQTRVYGPTLMLEVCREASRKGIAVGLYGGSEECLIGLQAVLREKFPALKIGYAYSPPFRPLSEAEDIGVVEAINRSGVRILFVGLGCPKQERWMHAHTPAVRAVQVGVGAAFAFHAGMVNQAPVWMQGMALEWLYRLLVEPRRLWRRYIIHNPRFIWLASLQLLGLLRVKP